MLWIETKTLDEAKSLYDRMWGLELHEAEGVTIGRVRGEGLYEDGVFWSEAIAKLMNDPPARLDMAIRYLPLPGAFHQAARALRAIVRERRKQKADYGPELRQLFHLAAILSFSVDYAPRLKQPGYNVFAHVPFAEFQSMSLTWDILGCDQLRLLTKTDRRWMIEAWGEPPIHMTAHDKYQRVWERYEDVLIADDRNRKDSLGAELRGMLTEFKRAAGP